MLNETSEKSEGIPSEPPKSSQDREDDLISNDNDDDDVLVRRKRLHKPSRKSDPTRKKRFIVSAFLDTEAQVGEEDEEDDNYEDDLILPDESTEAERLENRSRLKRLQDEGSRWDDRRIGGTGYLENAIDKLAKRYQDQTFEEGEDVDLFDDVEQCQYAEMEETSTLMPDFSDPKLWIVKLNRHGLSRQLAISLQNKFLKMQNEGRHLGLYSCFAPDGVSGYLYVEADSKANVIEALSEFRNVNMNSVRMVPLNEMATVFTMGIENRIVPVVGEYVRVKFGRYAGDLGQVIESDGLNSLVTIRIIPRLPPDVTLSDEFMDESVNQRAIADNSGFAVLKSKDPHPKNERAKRYEKKFFDKEHIEFKGGLIEQGAIPGTYRYRNMTFQESGHLLLRINIKRLITGTSVNATLSELKEFNVDSVDGILSEAVGLNMSKGPKKTLHLYKLGERVRVLKGELCNVVGKITCIMNDEIEIEPDNKGIPRFKIHWGCIVKHFVEGDNVRAISGMNEGETGLLALIDNEKKTAVVFSPKSGQEFKCSLEYLSLIPKEGLGGGDNQLGALNGFCVGELVQLSSGIVGVISSIERAGNFKVLAEDGDEIKCTSAQVLCKRNSFGHSCRDLNHHPIELKTKVVVVRGPFKQKIGYVQHMWKNTVFLSPEAGETIAVPADHCLSTAVSSSVDAVEKEKIGGKKLTVCRRSPFLGKTVKILQGRYKGLLGDIVNVEPGQFTVLLKVKPKTVRYKREDCVVMDNWHSYIRQQRQRSTSGSALLNSGSNLISVFNKNSTPNWAVKGVCVEVVGIGPYHGRFGIIGEVIESMADTNLHVLHVLVDEDYIAIAVESVVPTRPRGVGDSVFAFNRPKGEQIATLLAIHDEIGTLQTKDGAVFEEPLSGIALFDDQTEF